jgi:CRP/FNR family transcriptional regulator/CRP/FNR family cyclic AMP-dependent transcriptional regulator
MQAIEILRRSPLAHSLTPEQLAAVAALGQRAGFTAGESLTTLNEHESDLYVIGDGRVKFLTHDGDQLGESGPGGLVGEIAFVDGRVRTAHAVAVGYVDALRFPARELRALMVRDKELGFMLLANLSITLAHRLRTAIGQLDALMDLEEDVWTNAG